jgi:transcription initiation factor IIE alpha subunit
MKEQSIPCPVCQTTIPFDTQHLLMGVQFTCSKCNAQIGLSPEHKGTVLDTFDKLQKLKDDALKNKPS